MSKMSKLRSGVVFAIFFATTPLYAQVQSPRPEQASTRFEQFLSRKGQLLIKDFYDIDSFRAATIKVATLSSPKLPEKVYAARFAVPALSRYRSEQTGVLDYNDLKAVIDALTFMAQEATEMKK